MTPPSSFEEIVASFRSGYPENRRFDSTRLNWSDFDRWREQIETLFATMTPPEVVDAERAIYRLFAEGNTYDNFHRQAFVYYCCAAFLTRPSKNWRILVLLDNLMLFNAVTKHEPARATAQTTIRLIVEQFFVAICSEVAGDTPSAVFRDPAHRLPFLIELGLLLRVEFVNSLPPNLKTIDTLRTFPKNVRAVTPEILEALGQIDHVVAQLVRLHPDAVAPEIAAEIRQNNTEHVRFLADLDVYHQSVQDVLLDHVERQWIWGLQRTERYRLPDDIDSLCSYVTNPAFMHGRDRVASVLLQLLHVGGLAIHPTTRHMLIRRASSVAGESLLPEIVFELERERLDLDQQKTTRQAYDTAFSEWIKLRNEATPRFAKQATEATTTVVQLLQQLAGADKWGGKRIGDERRRHLLREDLIALFRGSPGLLANCTPVMIALFGDIENDVTAVITAVADEQTVEVLKAAAAGEAESEVRLRARVILSHLEGDPSLAFPENGRFSSVSHVAAYYDRLLASRGRAHAGYTWLEDETVERIVHRAFEAADERFSEFFSEQFLKHEPPLTERLLRHLEEQFEEVGAAIEQWSKNLRGGPIRVHLAYKDAQPVESYWNADVAFVLTLAVANRLRKESAILVQCKKMHSDRQKRQLVGSWTVDIVQCKGLIERSPFSYYFLFGPRDGLATQTLVVPATTIRGVTRTGDNYTRTLSRSVPLRRVRHMARSLADFMCYDFIGSWVGDEREDIVAWARGDLAEQVPSGSRFAAGLGPPPRFLITLSVTQGRDGNQ